MDDDLTRRRFLQLTGRGAVAITVGGAAGLLSACDPGSLGPPDANGLRLLDGFTSRVVATTGEEVGTTGHTWHKMPDGGACFPLADGGWSYVSNSEWLPNDGGGAGYVRFAADGTIVGAGRCLDGTLGNCAGGPTPWGTWLSCEEWPSGRVWECQPTGPAAAAVARPAMGAFQHEAAAVDEANRCVYLTEDLGDGALYRFRPTTWGDLSAGVLEVMTEVGGTIGWAVVPDPDGNPTPTRDQVPGTKRFRGGEGATISAGRLVFTTKSDNRVWLYDPATNRLSVVYDPAVQANGVLTGVDNATVSGGSAIYVCEDGGDMQIVLVREDGRTFPVVQLTDVTGSELAGCAFDPSGRRLYFSSQRNPGRTYEVTGSWGVFNAPGTRGL